MPNLADVPNLALINQDTNSRGRVLRATSVGSNGTFGYITIILRIVAKILPAGT